MLSLTVVTALALAAPPPSRINDNPGRIAVWLEDKIEHFDPDGGDVKPIMVPDGVAIPQYSMRLAASRKYGIYLKYNIDKFNRIPDWDNPRLGIIPLEAGRKPYHLESFVVYGPVLAFNEDKLYFRGDQGDNFDQFKTYNAPTYVLNLATNNIAAFPMPDRHEIVAVGRDGRTFFTRTRHVDLEKNTFSQKWYVIHNGERPVEVLNEKAIPRRPEFDPYGSKIVMDLTECSDVEVFVSGDKHMISHHREKCLGWVFLDVATRKVKPIQNLPTKSISYLVLSPDGAKLAYLWRDPPNSVVKVFVADADGSNPKEVYKTKSETAWALIWK
jgi:hypothetical protein